MAGGVAQWQRPWQVQGSGFYLQHCKVSQHSNDLIRSKDQALEETSFQQDGQPAGTELDDAAATNPVTCSSFPDL